MPSLTSIAIFAALTAWLINNYLHSGPHTPILQALTGGIIQQIPKNVPVEGFTAPGYEILKEHIVEQIVKGKTLGAQFEAYAGDLHVASLAAGWKDDSYKEPYTRNTLQVVWSSGKGVMAIVMAHLVSQGHVSYDDLVSKHWPEFAQGGKEKITVAELMMHRGGVPYLDPDYRVTVEEMSSEDPQILDKVAKKLAAQPHGHPNHVQAYHAITRGFYLAELIRRVHPQHLTYRQLVQQLGKSIDPSIEVYCGLPPKSSNSPNLESRVSPLRGYPLPHILTRLFVPSLHPSGAFPPAFAAQGDKDSLIAKAVQSTPLDPTWKLKDFPYFANNPKQWYATNPSAGTLTNAHALVEFAAVMANKGTWRGKTLIDKDTWKQATTPMPPEQVYDATLDINITMTKGGVGSFATRKVPLHLVSTQPYEPHWLDSKWKDWDWQGWAGAGGSMISWESKRKLAFAYVMNSHYITVIGDERSSQLFEDVIDIGISRGDIKA